MVAGTIRITVSMIEASADERVPYWSSLRPRSGGWKSSGGTGAVPNPRCSCLRERESVDVGGPDVCRAGAPCEGGGPGDHSSV